MQRGSRKLILVPGLHGESDPGRKGGKEECRVISPGELHSTLEPGLLQLFTASLPVPWVSLPHNVSESWLRLGDHEAADHDM